MFFPTRGLGGIEIVVRVRGQQSGVRAVSIARRPVGRPQRFGKQPGQRAARNRLAS